MEPLGDLADIPPNANVLVSEHFFDSDGNPLDGPEGAVSVEIHEIDPNGLVKRTYLELGG